MDAHFSNEGRSSFGLVAVQDKLYSIGGQDESIECYDAVRDTWDTIQAKMKNKHFGITPWNNSIIICGGLDNNKIQLLDPRQPNWTKLGDCENIQHSTLVSLHDCIYRIGGSLPDTGSTNTVNYFDMKMRTWHSVAELYCSRSEHTAVHYEGKIIALGGYGNSSIEEYSPETDQWRVLPAMPEGRSSFGTTVILGLS